MKRTILLAVLPGIEDLAEALLDREDLEIVVLHEHAVETLSLRGIPCRSLLSFLTEADRQAATEESVRRITAVGAPLFSSEAREQWPEFDDGTWERLLDKVTGSLGRAVYEEIATIEALRACAGQRDLRLVVVPHDLPRGSKTVVQYAHRLGIPAFHLIHGIPAGSILASTLGEPWPSDRVAVTSEECKLRHERLGVPSERIIVTGNPQWDAHHAPPWAGTRLSACELLPGLDPARPVIVYGMTFGHTLSRVGVQTFGFSEATTRALFSAMAELSRRHPDWQFVVRPHPNDAHQSQNLLARAHEAGIAKVWVDSPPMDSFKAVVLADCIVCIESNLGVEAILAGTPVVNCVVNAEADAFFNEGLGPLFDDEDAVVQARSPETIAPAIEAAIADPDTRARLRAARERSTAKFNHTADGRALERVCEAILDMIDHGGGLVPPVSRWPECEALLAATVPAEATRIAVVGRAAEWVSASIRERHSKAELRCYAALSPDVAVGEGTVLVLADPLPAGSAAGEVLAAAYDLAAPSCTLVCAVRNGADPSAQRDEALGGWVPARPGMDAPSAVGMHKADAVAALFQRSGWSLSSVCVPTDLTNNVTHLTPSACPPAAAIWAVTAAPAAP